MNTIKKIQVGGVDYDIQAKELTKINYADLKGMRDRGELVVGHLYRITDYKFTTIQDKTKSAGHPFDIIVLATAENQLSEQARAIQREGDSEGDTYFDGNDLGAWELWYDLDNDTTKYEWADDTENGRGVIYRMIDEKRNDCPYDFKNALFNNTKLTSPTTSDRFYYTFSYIVNGELYDGTVNMQVKNCYGNSMGIYIKSGKKSLNLNVFRNTSFGNSCNSNKFGDSCYSNTFGEYCYSNTFGEYCYSNTFGEYCYSNTFGDYCYSNTFGDYCEYNTFGGGVSHRGLVSSKYTSITENSEYFDDGSGQLVPIKHPDPSTQPSILPYKFMGQYVYEQLIPVKVGDIIVFCDFMVDHPMILSATVFGVNSFKNVDVRATKSDALLLNTRNELDGYINIKYTDGSQLLPSDGYGYGYEDNNTESPKSIDFGLTLDKTQYIYDSNTEVLSLYGYRDRLFLISLPTNVPLKNIILGEGVVDFSILAFNGESSLESFTIPKSVTSIKVAAFQNCSNLKRFTIPINSQLMSIEVNAFQNCSSLTSITIPKNVTGIGNYAFDGCGSLTAVTTHINSQLTRIGTHVFRNCRSLTSIIIPKNVTSIGNLAFQYCRSLTSIIIQEDSQLTSIGSSAFSGCSSLTSITIPASVTSIDKLAFSNCRGITSITCKATNPPTIFRDTFSNVNKSIPVYVPSASVDAYKAATSWKNFTNIQAI